MKYGKFIKISNIAFIIIIVQILFIILSNCAFVNATDMKGIYTAPEGASTVTDKAGKILGYITAIGVSIGVIMIAVMGFKYITSSPEGKADLKRQLIPYFIGAVILTSGSTFIGIIANTASSTLNT